MSDQLQRMPQGAELAGLPPLDTIKPPPAQLPTEDEFFGAEKLPTEDEFFGPSPRSIARMPQGAEYAGLMPPEPEEHTPEGPGGRILGAFGQGAATGWGTGSVGLGEGLEQVAELGDWFKDARTGQVSIVQAFNGAILRPLAAGVDYAISGMNAAFAAAQAGVAQAGKEAEAAGVPGGAALGRDIAAIPEAFMGTPHPFGPASPRAMPSALPEAAFPMFEASRAAWEAEAAKTATIMEQYHAGRVIYDAHINHVIGRGGERAYFGLDDPPPLDPAWGVEAARGAPAEVSPPPADIHGRARMLAPDVFAEYDMLAGERDRLRAEVADAQAELARNAEAQAPGAAEIADLEARLEDTTPRLRKKYEARLEELRPAYEAFLADEDGMALLRRETPEIAALRQELMEADYRMRDMAPDVTRAYREAEAQMPVEMARADEISPPRSGELSPAEEVAPKVEEAQKTAVAPEVPAPASEKSPARAGTPDEFSPPPEAAAPSIAHQAPPVDIAADVARKLEAAGRPADEAAASAAIIDAYWQTRAAHLGEDAGALYSRFGSDIRAGGEGGRGGRGQGKIRLPAAERTREYAQSQAGKLSARDGRSIITLFDKADASTFMHETGHEWLERLMADGANPEAPAGFKTDAATVRKWLGMDADQDVPTTRQHEKFARGFEQYLREGHAPSPGLAGVFAQFKDWLTRIYESVKALGKPISNDIRDVFDRFLAVDPEKRGAVIAPEREFVSEGRRAPKEPPVAVTDDLAVLHEADAQHTAPADAAPAAARIREEIDHTTQTHAPEIADEIAGRTGSGSDRGTGGDSPPSGRAGSGGSEAGTAARQGDSVSESGAIDAGRGNAAPQGNRASERTDPPANPNQQFDTPASDLIDKAGNIRLDNLNIPEDVAQAIREAAAQNEDFITARRGVVSDSQVLDLADALGMTPQDLAKRKVGEAYNAEQVMAARKLLIESATTVRDLAKKAANGAEADILAFTEAKARHVMIQGQVAGITAEAGRALRAFRFIGGEKGLIDGLDAFLRDNTGRTLFQMQEEARQLSMLDTPGKASKFIRDSEKPGFKDMIAEFWINSLLSGPQTHIANMLGNTIAAAASVLETGLAAGVGKLREGLGGARGVEFSEAQGRLYGLMQGAQDGLKVAATTFRDEGFSHAGQSVEQRRFQAIPSANIGGMEIGGKQLRIPTRLLAAEDELFKAIAYRQEINAQAYRIATQEGLEGAAFRARVTELVTDPPEAMMAAGKKNAEYQTFTNSLGATGRAMQAFSNSHILAKLLVPFIRTPVNILKYAMERTPASLLSPEVRGNLRGVNGAVAQDTQIARILLGTAVAAGVVGLATQGLITGSGPSDPEEMALWRLSGKQPYAVKVGDMWYGVRRLDPFAFLFGLAADAYQLGSQVGEKPAEKLAGLFVLSIGKSFLEGTGMRGLADMVRTVSDPGRYGGHWTQSFISSFSPFGGLSGQIARAIDPYARDARTLLDTLKAKTPFLSQALPPKYDIFGNPIPSREALGPDALSVIYETKINNDPVVQAMQRLHVFPDAVDRKIRGVELTPQEYAEFAHSAGVLAKMQLDVLIGGRNGFSGLPDGIQQQTITQTISGARQTAQSMMLMKHPHIMTDALAAKKVQLIEGKKPK